MARIVLGLGTSHTPMLLVDGSDLPRYEENDRRLLLLDFDGEPVTLDALTARASGRHDLAVTAEQLSARHAAAHNAMAGLADALASAALDALIVIGDDQKEMLRGDQSPPLLVYDRPSIRSQRPAACPESARVGPPRVRSLLSGGCRARLSGGARAGTACNGTPEPPVWCGCVRGRRCPDGPRVCLRPFANHARPTNPDHADPAERAVSAERSLQQQAAWKWGRQSRVPSRLIRRIFVSGSSHQAASVTSLLTRILTAR